MPSASIRPPALVRNPSSWSIAGAHYKHWATSLGNFGVTPFFGGNFLSVSRFAMQVSLANVWSSAMCQSPAAARWNMILSKMSVSAMPPALCMAMENRNSLLASWEDGSSTMLSSSISADESERCRCHVGWLSCPCILRDLVLVRYKSYKVLSDASVRKMEMVADPVPILGSSCPGGRNVISLFQRPVVPGWRPSSERASMRGLADKMLRLERVNVSLFISLPHGGSLGRPLALCPRRRFRAGFILTSGNYACIYMSDKNAFICH